MDGYTHIVIGAGAIGSAAAYWLSRQPGTRVLVLEQYGLVNSRNSSSDHSRIIRHAYHSTAYTQLTRAMYDTWAEIEELSGLQLVHRTGGLDLAVAGSPWEADLHGYARAMSATGTVFETLEAAEIRSRYPQWVVGDDTVALFQEEAGLVDIRRSVSAHTSLALANGVEFRPHTKVVGVTLRDESVTVSTGAGTFAADYLVVATASWLPELMPDLGLEFRLTLSQEQVSYFASRRLADFAPDRFPVWIYHDAQVVYGFPVYGEAGVKLARDMRGRFISSDQRVFEGEEEEAELLRTFLEQHLPTAAGPTLVSKTCVYDMPADREFVLDTVPGHSHVAVFNGAGHGGKFASLVGQILSDLVTDGASRQPIEAFRLTRPAITDPDFVPAFSLRPSDLPTGEPGPAQESVRITPPSSVPAP